MALTPQQLERYKRHILLPEIGGQGQQKLLHAKILVVGAGGLGAPILYYLGAAGIGHIGICDDDEVSLSNLQRQILYTEADLGQPKTRCAKARLQALNPEINIILHEERLSADNAAAFIAGYDLIIEGVDNFAARFHLNAACIAARKPFLSAAIGRFDGQVALFKPWQDEEAPCYRCLVPDLPPDAATCEELGVLGVVPGVVGSLAALAALRDVIGLGVDVGSVQPHHALLIFEGMTGQTRQLRLRRDPACSDCRALDRG